LPKFERGFKLFAKEGDTNILPFDKALHVEVKGGAAPVNSFPSTGGGTPPANAGGANALWDKSADNEDPFAVDPNISDAEDPFAVEE